jgi:hypothetical protein
MQTNKSKMQKLHCAKIPQPQHEASKPAIETLQAEREIKRAVALPCFG